MFCGIHNKPLSDTTFQILVISETMSSKIGYTHLSRIKVVTDSQINVLNIIDQREKIQKRKPLRGNLE